MGSQCCKCAKQNNKNQKVTGHYSDSTKIRFCGDQLISSNQYNVQTHGNIVQLTLKQLQKDDTNHYTLITKKILKYPLTKNRIYEEPLKTIRMNIQEVSNDPVEGEPPSFIRRLTDLAVKVGTRTRFLVEIRSSTNPKVTWHRNDYPVQEESRFTFVHEGNFYRVDVAPVMIEDQGLWTCMVENTYGRSSCTSFLNVIVPKAYKPPEFIEELQALLSETGIVSLECKVIGVPTPVLRWFKDDQEIKAGNVFALTANVNDPTSLGIYTCQATNSLGTVYSSSKVHVVGRGSREGSLKPADTLNSSGPLPVFKKSLNNESCKIGDTIILFCQVQVPPWPKNITWYNKEGKVESNNKYHIMEDGLGTYSIEIKEVEAMDEGEWKCVATSDKNVMQLTTCYVSMLIPKNYRTPRFMESLKAILTDEGLVSFECKVVGFPIPLLRWFKDGQELKPGDVYQLTGTNSLGSYCCIARNCMGETKSTAELTIEDIQNQLNDEERLQLLSYNQVPKFLKGLTSCEAKIEEYFTFTIQVSMTVQDLTFLWYRDDEPIIESDKYKITRTISGNCTLEIQKLEFIDQAEWKCVAENDFGHSITSCFLKLIIPKHFKKPKFLESLRAILNEEGAVNLECKVIGVPQPILTWYKDGTELKPGDIHRITSGQDGTCCLGMYTCKAMNCMGSVSSSASLLGFENKMTIKKEEIKIPNSPISHDFARNLSLSTINEERTSQLYDTPQTDYSITVDDKGEISFSFDGKEVSVSLYETPDLTEEEAIQIVEMYADQFSEHITEGNIIELPPMRFTKETSITKNLLMEAVVIDVSPEYFAADEEIDDLRTEADFEDVSIIDDQMQSILSSYSSLIGEEHSKDRIANSLSILNLQTKKKQSESDSSSNEKCDKKEKDQQKIIDWSESYHSAKEPSFQVHLLVQSEDSIDAFADALSSEGSIKTSTTSFEKDILSSSDAKDNVDKLYLNKTELKQHKDNDEEKQLSKAIELISTITNNTKKQYIHENYEIEKEILLDILKVLFNSIFQLREIINNFDILLESETVIKKQILYELITNKIVHPIEKICEQLSVIKNNIIEFASTKSLIQNVNIILINSIDELIKELIQTLKLIKNDKNENQEELNLDLIILDSLTDSVDKILVNLITIKYDLQNKEDNEFIIRPKIPIALEIMKRVIDQFGINLNIFLKNQKVNKFKEFLRFGKKLELIYQNLDLFLVSLSLNKITGAIENNTDILLIKSIIKPLRYLYRSLHQISQSQREFIELNKIYELENIISEFKNELDVLTITLINYEKKSEKYEIIQKNLELVNYLKWAISDACDELSKIKQLLENEISTAALTKYEDHSYSYLADKFEDNTNILESQDLKLFEKGKIKYALEKKLPIELVQFETSIDDEKLNSRQITSLNSASLEPEENLLLVGIHLNSLIDVQAKLIVALDHYKCQISSDWASFPATKLFDALIELHKSILSAVHTTTTLSVKDTTNRIIHIKESLSNIQIILSSSLSSEEYILIEEIIKPLNELNEILSAMTRSLSYSEQSKIILNNIAEIMDNILNQIMKIKKTKILPENSIKSVTQKITAINLPDEIEQISLTFTDIHFAISSVLEKASESSNNVIEIIKPEYEQSNLNPTHNFISSINILRQSIGKIAVNLATPVSFENSKLQYNHNIVLEELSTLKEPLLNLQKILLIEKHSSEERYILNDIITPLRALKKCILEMTKSQSFEIVQLLEDIEKDSLIVLEGLKTALISSVSTEESIKIIIDSKPKEVSKILTTWLNPIENWLTSQFEETNKKKEVNYVIISTVNNFRRKLLQIAKMSSYSEPPSDVALIDELAKLDKFLLEVYEVIINQNNSDNIEIMENLIQPTKHLLGIILDIFLIHQADSILKPVLEILEKLENQIPLSIKKVSHMKDSQKAAKYLVSQEVSGQDKFNLKDIHYLDDSNNVKIESEIKDNIEALEEKNVIITKEIKENEERIIQLGIEQTLQPENISEQVEFFNIEKQNVYMKDLKIVESVLMDTKPIEKHTIQIETATVCVEELDFWTLTILNPLDSLASTVLYLDKSLDGKIYSFLYQPLNSLHKQIKLIKYRLNQPASQLLENDIDLIIQQLLSSIEQVETGLKNAADSWQKNSIENTVLKFLQNLLMISSDLYQQLDSLRIKLITEAPKQTIHIQELETKLIKIICAILVPLDDIRNTTNKILEKTIRDDEKNDNTEELTLKSDHIPNDDVLKKIEQATTRPLQELIEAIVDPENVRNTSDSSEIVQSKQIIEETNKDETVIAFKLSISDPNELQKIVTTELQPKLTTEVINTDKLLNVDVKIASNIHLSIESDIKNYLSQINDIVISELDRQNALSFKCQSLMKNIDTAVREKITKCAQICQEHVFEESVRDIVVDELLKIKKSLEIDNSTENEFNYKKQEIEQDSKIELKIISDKKIIEIIFEEIHKRNIPILFPENLVQRIKSKVDDIIAASSDLKQEDVLKNKIQNIVNDELDLFNTEENFENKILKVEQSQENKSNEQVIELIMLPQKLEEIIKNMISKELDKENIYLSNDEVMIWETKIIEKVSSYIKVIQENLSEGLLKQIVKEEVEKYLFKKTDLKNLNRLIQEKVLTVNLNQNSKNLETEAILEKDTIFKEQTTEIKNENTLQILKEGLSQQETSELKIHDEDYLFEFKTIDGADTLDYKHQLDENNDEVKQDEIPKDKTQLMIMSKIDKTDTEVIVSDKFINNSTIEVLDNSCTEMKSKSLTENEIEVTKELQNKNIIVDELVHDMIIEETIKQQVQSLEDESIINNVEQQIKDLIFMHPKERKEEQNVNILSIKDFSKIEDEETNISVQKNEQKEVQTFKQIKHEKMCENTYEQNIQLRKKEKTNIEDENKVQEFNVRYTEKFVTEMIHEKVEDNIADAETDQQVKVSEIEILPKADEQIKEIKMLEADITNKCNTEQEKKIIKTELKKNITKDNEENEISTQKTKTIKKEEISEVLKEIDDVCTTELKLDDTYEKINNLTKELNSVIQEKEFDKIYETKKETETLEKSLQQSSEMLFEVPEDVIHDIIIEKINKLKIEPSEESNIINTVKFKIQDSIFLYPEVSEDKIQEENVRQINADQFQEIEAKIVESHETIFQLQKHENKHVMGSSFITHIQIPEEVIYDLDIEKVNKEEIKISQENDLEKVIETQINDLIVQNSEILKENDFKESVEDIVTKEFNKQSANIFNTEALIEPIQQKKTVEIFNVPVITQKQISEDFVHEIINELNEQSIEPLTEEYLIKAVEVKVYDLIAQHPLICKSDSFNENVKEIISEVLVEQQANIIEIQSQLVRAKQENERIEVQKAQSKISNETDTMSEKLTIVDKHKSQTILKSDEKKNIQESLTLEKDKPEQKLSKDNIIESQKKNDKLKQKPSKNEEHSLESQISQENSEKYQLDDRLKNSKSFEIETQNMYKDRVSNFIIEKESTKGDKKITKYTKESKKDEIEYTDKKYNETETFLQLNYVGSSNENINIRKKNENEKNILKEMSFEKKIKDNSESDFLKSTTIKDYSIKNNNNNQATSPTIETIDYDDTLSHDLSSQRSNLLTLSKKHQNLEFLEYDDKSISHYSSVTSRLPTFTHGPKNRGKKPLFCTELTDRTVTENSRIKLTCTILSESELKVCWLKNGKILSSSSNKHGISLENGMALLELYNVQSKDAGVYTCIAQNSHGEVSTEAKLKVYSGYNPTPSVPIFTRSIKDIYYKEENTLVLECRVRSQPSLTISWLKDGQVLEIGGCYQQSDLVDGICRLKIFHPNDNDSGLYTCRAENETRLSDKTSYLIDFKDSGRSKSISWHKSRSIYNDITGIDKDFGRPQFSSYLIDYNVSVGETASTATELETKTSIYQISNTFGHIDTTTNIEVITGSKDRKPAIFISRPPDKLIIVAVGEDVSVSFRAGGVPKPKVIWMKGLRDITNGPRSYKEKHDDYVRLTLKCACLSDEGTYCILLKNPYGCDRSFFSIQVKQRARSLTSFSDWDVEETDKLLATIHNNERLYIKQVPEPISSDPVVIDGGRNWLTLTWGKPEQKSPAPVIAYRVDAWMLGRDGGARWVELGVTPVNSFDAFNLQPGEEYKFRITPRNRYGWGESVTMENSVTVREVVKFPEFTKILSGQIKALQGTVLSLECEVSSDTNVEIKWYRDTIEIKNGQDSRFTTYFNGIKCSLMIGNITKSDSGRYICEAKNTAGRVSTFVRVQVINDPKIVEADLKLCKMRASDTIHEDRLPEFTMRLRDRRVQVTYPVRLTCQVTGYPEPEVIWYKDYEELQSHNNILTWKDEAHFHTLEIIRATIDDSGIYIAQAKNAYGSVSCHCHLIVDKGIRAYIAPKIISHLDQVYTVETGGELRMTARVEAYPTIGITWHRNSHRLRPSRDVTMTLNYDGMVELNLAHITLRDEGLYCCTATNEVGQAKTTTRVIVLKCGETENINQPLLNASLDIPYSKEPIFITKPLSTEAYEGDTVVILCEVIGDPKPEVMWLRDFLRHDYYKDASQFRRVGAGYQYRLEIPYAKLDFTGTYSIIAKNCHGQTKAVISLQIYARGQGTEDSKMEPTIKHGANRIVMTNLLDPSVYSNVQTLPEIKRPLRDLRCCDGDAISLACEIYAIPEPHVRWEKGGKLISLGGDFTTEFDGDTARLSIQHVYPEDEGEYTCVAFNDLGKAYTSACLIVNVPEGKETAISRKLIKPSGHLSPNSTPISTPRSTPVRSLSPSCISKREVTSTLKTLREYKEKRTKLPTNPKFYAVPHNKIAEEGETIRFQCAIAGYPVPWVTWDKDGIPITPTARISLKENDDMRFLKITGVNCKDAGLYRVTLENDMGKTEASARLDIIKSRRNSISRSMGTRSTSPRTYSIYGSRSNVSPSSRCDYSLRPPHISYSEEKETIIPMLPRYHRNEKYSTQVNAKSNKTTHASKNNKINRTIRSSSIPRIHQRLKECEKPQLKKIFASSKKFKKINQLCQKEQDIVKNNKSVIETNLDINYLTLKEITPNEGHKNEIEVENQFEKSSQFINITVEGPPESPRDLEIIKNNNKLVEVILSWRSPVYDGGSAITSYFIEMRKGNESCWVTIAEVKYSLSHKIQRLDPEESYRFKVRAKNIHGLSEPSMESKIVNLNNDIEQMNQVIELSQNSEEDFKQFEPDSKVILEPGYFFEKRYDVLEELGKGRYGVVKRVLEKTTGLIFAAKFVRTIKAKDKQQAHNEINIMNTLKHPKLLRLLAAFESPKETIMITEYISGGELFERVVADDFILTEKDSILFVRQICQAVEYLHNNKVVHLDLKPENIMCYARTSHRIKLIDFGLAQTLNPDTPVRVLFGTPEFIPPEIISFEPIGTESDMWSIGVICYVLLTGLSPFMGENDAETFANITRAEYDFDDKAFHAISQEAKNFISCLLIKRKESRISATECLKHPWLAQCAESMSRIVLPTDKLKKFIVRRKWQKTGNAIRALGRMTILSANSKKNITSSLSTPKDLEPNILKQVLNKHESMQNLYKIDKNQKSDEKQPSLSDFPLNKCIESADLQTIIKPLDFENDDKIKKKINEKVLVINESNNLSNKQIDDLRTDFITELKISSDDINKTDKNVLNLNDITTKDTKNFCNVANIQISESKQNIDKYLVNLTKNNVVVDANNGAKIVDVLKKEEINEKKIPLIQTNLITLKSNTHLHKNTSKLCCQTNSSSLDNEDKISRMKKSCLSHRVVRTGSVSRTAKMFEQEEISSSISIKKSTNPGSQKTFTNSNTRSQNERIQKAFAFWNK